MTQTPQDYVNASVATVQCPRCGLARDIPVVAKATGSIEFAGVCSTALVGGGVCSTTLRLVVSAHVFPAS
ncbi:MAG: hypothetical protein ACR2OD_01765 [Gaiellaceae bacterium]